MTRVVLLSLLLLLLILAAVPVIGAARPSRIKLADVKALTFRHNFQTAARRSTPIAELQCTNGPCGEHRIDAVQCTNVGDAGYGNVQWRCEAQLPSGVRLTSINVNCEGYDNPDDEYVLVGSCGLSYGLVDERRDSGSRHQPGGSAYNAYHRPPVHTPPPAYGVYSAGSDYSDLTSSSGDVMSWVFFAAVVGVLIYVFTRRHDAPVGPTQGAGEGRTWGSGGGGGGPYGGGGGGGGGTFTSGYGGSYTQTQAPPPPPQQQGWRPGFWTGLFGGTMLARMFTPTTTYYGGGRGYFNRWGANTAAYTGGGTGYAAPPPSSPPATTTATGYGGTSRR